jgi:hypothetical protein
MAEISEKQRALRKKHKTEDIKVIFRVTKEQKAKLVDLVEFHNTDLSAFCRKFIDIAWAAKLRGDALK